MKTNFNELLKAAKNDGHDLNSLINLTEKFSSLLNPDVEIKEIPEFGFNSLEEFPNARYFSLTLEDFIQAAKIRNGEISESGVPGKRF